MAFARSAEAAGFDTLLVSDHFGPRMSAAPALVLAAQATERMRVGSFVYDNDFRHPGLLAQEAASIDLLTDGRFDFGIGAGWLRSEYDAAGLDFAPGKVRVERLAESIQVIKSLLAGSPVSYEGQHYRLKELTAGFKTVQQPHPPFIIGGGGPGLLTLAAREADIVSIMPRSKRDGAGLEDSDASAESFDRKVALIRQAAGDRFGRLELNTLVQEVIVTDDRPAAAQNIAQDWEMSPAELLESPLLLIGSPGQLGEQLIARRERFGLSYISIFERHMAGFTEVIRRLRAQA
jgi:probable F420-dependent oxidoreductase